jgi:phage-related tail protein
VKKWIYLVALTVGVAACNKAQDSTLTADAAGTTGAAAEPTVAERVAAVVSPKYADVTIPSGTTLRLELTSDVGSDTSSVEQRVTASLRDPVTIDGQIALPAGSEVMGVVTDVEKSGRVKGRAHVAYRFNTVHASGENYDIQTASISHQAEATKGKDATKIAIGAGAGAAVGALLGGKSGAAKGAAVGGAGGTGVVLATKGNEIHVGSGADISTKLTAPMIVRVRL